MKTGKITTKLRDAVPVCLMVEGREVKRYKNIELPDIPKEAEMLDFHFNVPMDGKITFEIHYAPGILPETFPEPRAKVTRAEKAAAKAQKEAMQEETADTPAPEETALATIPEEPPIMESAEPEEAIAKPGTAEDAAEQAPEIPEPAEDAKANKASPIIIQKRSVAHMECTCKLYKIDYEAKEEAEWMEALFPTAFPEEEPADCSEYAEK